MNQLELAPEVFTERLAQHGGRAYIVRDRTGSLLASHDFLGKLVDFLHQDKRDHLEHEALFFEVGPETGALLTAFVHQTTRGQGAGGVRHWKYARLEDLLRDGLRLSVGMTRKNALAGLWWGGAKGVIARQPGDRYQDPEYRRQLYREYGSFISSLRGCYVTAEDAGTTPPDMLEVFSRTRHTTCIPPAFGGSGNPSEPTAKGVVCAMEAALDFHALGNLEGKTIAMQGAGNVSGFMIGELLARGVARIVASEISKERIAELEGSIRDARLSLRHVMPDDLSIFDEPADVLAPNGLGGVLNPDTIPRIRARLVCGAANNQLLDAERDDRALSARDISYVPDFLCNRMGIVNCANEQYGSILDDPAVQRHFSRDWESSIFVVTQRVLARARDEGLTTATAATLIADELARRPHPLWPERSRQIIEGLVSSGWHQQRA
jgi:glutamate dehydrogenase/leucine dehydrogenase